VATFVTWFASAERTVTLYSQGVNQSSAGVDKVNAIINCHLLTGRIGRPGMGPFSITGQPNAMGGREVGGLASTLAAHMDFAPDNVARVGRFWAAPTMATKPGLKAVDLFRAINEGRIKALWIMATNPAVSLPDAARVREALASIPFLIVSDIMAQTDSSAHAHVRLPAAGWGEKDGTVTNSDRTISRQRAFLPLPGEARPDWWIVTQVARRMGWRSAFAYDRPADIWREHARLTAYQNDGARLLNLRAHATIGNDAYDAMEPFRWGGAPFADGRYPTPDGKARLVLTKQMDLQPPLRDWPLTLNTGRYRDQWHSMTRTGLSPKLARHREEPLVEVHPDDAQALGLADGDLARVATPQGDSLFRAHLTEGQRPGEIFTPIHWTDQVSTGGRTGLLPRRLVDPHSGQPGFKSTPASLAKVTAEWKGFLILRGTEPVTLPCLWATRVTVSGGTLYEIAGNGDPARLETCLPKGDRVEAIDQTRGTRRIAILRDGRLAAVLFVTRTGLLPSRDWLIGQLEAEQVTASVLAARGPGARPDKGATICVCFDIGLNQIVAAIRDQSLVDVPAIGQAIGAGTNCGSCRPALANILAQTTQETLHAAE
ncbi:MAG: molybdopterin-dependent oxidoreductase, partial [Sphingobium sp.]